MGMGKTTVSAGNAASGCMAVTMSDAGASAWAESTVARDLLNFSLAGSCRWLCCGVISVRLLSCCRTYDCLCGRRLGHDCVHGWKNGHGLRVAHVLCVRSDRGHLSPAPAACVGLVRDGRPQTRCCNGHVLKYQHPLRTPPRVSSDEAPILEDTDALRRCHDPLPSMPFPS